MAKRTAVDFLKVLSKVTVPQHIYIEGTSSKPIETQIEEVEEPLELQMPKIAISGSPILMKDWYDADHNFATFHPSKLISYLSDFPDYGAIESTSPTIPNSKIVLNPLLQKQPDNLKILKLQNSKSIAPIVFDYRDIFQTTGTNRVGVDDITKLAVLHVVNHIFNDMDVKERSDPANVIEKDFGYTPTTVLILCPTRLRALAILKTIIDVLPPDFEAEHYDEMRSEYGAEDLPENVKRYKARDYLEIFGGNADSSFSTGVRFFRNKVSMKQVRAKSQLILASPASIAAIEIADRAFLSSVDVLVLDCLDALMMQQEEIAQTIIESVSAKKPLTIEHTNWNRLRGYAALEQMRYMRQTIAYGQVVTPTIKNLLLGFVNARGLAIVRPLAYTAAVSGGLERTFRRIDVADYHELPERLPRFFRQRMLPQIKEWRMTNAGKRTLIYFSNSMECVAAKKILIDEDVHFLWLDDEVEKNEARETRNEFKDDPNAVLLLTERYYFTFRPKIAAIERVVFMQLPNYPQFVPELVGSYPATFYFTPFDALALERIVGTRRLKQVMSSEMYAF